MTGTKEWFIKENCLDAGVTYTVKRFFFFFLDELEDYCMLCCKQTQTFIITKISYVIKVTSWSKSLQELRKINL